MSAAAEPTDRRPDPEPTATPSWRLAPRVTGLLVLLLGLVISAAFLWGCVDLLEPRQQGDIGPGAFPAGAALLLLAAALVVGRQAWRGAAQPALLWDQPTTTLWLGLSLPALLLLWQRLQQAQQAAWVWGLFGLFALLLQWLLGERRPSWLLAGSAALASLLWLVFGRLMKLPL